MHRQKRLRWRQQVESSPYKDLSGLYQSFRDKNAEFDLKTMLDATKNAATEVYRYFKYLEYTRFKLLVADAQASLIEISKSYSLMNCSFSPEHPEVNHLAVAAVLGDIFRKLEIRLRKTSPFDADASLRLHAAFEDLAHREELRAGDREDRAERARTHLETLKEFPE